MVAFMAAGLLLSSNVYAGDHKKDSTHGAKKHEAAAKVNHCIGSGPQSPRDIDMTAGTNGTTFSVASPEGKNLCNVHFHRNAEHKAKAYSKYVESGINSGWACSEPTATDADRHSSHKGCGNVAPGDTIEVHWVYTSCDINAPGAIPNGPGLSACSTTTCANPQLRVVAEVFVLQESGGLAFTEAAPVAFEGSSVTYIGSTTGRKYSNDNCSPYQVTWDVKETCGGLNIGSINAWCDDNKYGENHAHDVRDLVTPENLLSTIGK